MDPVTREELERFRADVERQLRELREELMGEVGRAEHRAARRARDQLARRLS